MYKKSVSRVFFMAIQNKTPLHKQFEIMKILANLIPIN